VPKQVSNVAPDDYLTAIYRLAHDEGENVIGVLLAARLHVTPPSVAGMLKRLQRDGLVSIDSRKAISLTDEGLVRAEQMVRRHRLAECLLTEVLNVPWWRAYDEAHLLEHGISEVTEPHLVGTLGNPTHSPFGYPIPGAGPNGPLPSRTLADTEEGELVVVDRVFEEDEALLKFFHEERILPDARLTLLSVGLARGTVTAALEGREIVMGTQVAARIWIRRDLGTER